MQYFVIDASGNRYGPADVATLNSWANEGRVLPNMMLEEQGTGIRSMASTVPGIVFPNTAPPGGGGQPYGQPYGQPPGPQYAQYTRPGNIGYGGQSEMNTAWICGVLGIICCGPLAIAGLINANKAQAMGHPGANGARILNIVALCLWGVGIIANIALSGLLR